MPINDNFTFDGQNSADFGLMMASDPESVHPSRRGTSSQIVGRNGVFVREDGSFDTYTQTYDVLLDSRSEGVYARARRVANWLLGSRGFCRLEDTFEPDVFKLARYAKQLSVENRLTRFGRAQIAFEVQPQRYLKLGETEIGIDSGVDSGNVYYGTIRVYGIPHGAVSAYMESATGVSAVGTFRGANGVELGQFYDTPVSIPTGTVRIDCAWNNADSSTSVVFGIVDKDGDRTVLCGVTGTSPAIFNPTQFEARPLLKFVDTSEEPDPVSQTLTNIYNTGIDVSGNVTPVASGSERRYTTQPVSTEGYAYAIVTGTAYTFYNSRGQGSAADRYGYGKVISSERANLRDKKIVIPSEADTIVIEGEMLHYAANLSLQAARPNPGASAVTINGTTISLDFSVHDTIYLDCDIHDAYYIGGSSANDKVSFTSDIDPYPTFPGFAPGENTVIVRDGDNLDFSVVPRWWEL